MISLFISTATKKIVVAIVKDNNVISCFNEDNDNTLSERIMPIIDDTFKKVNLTLNDVDSIYVVNGPGSFTGIRIGVTIAKVIAWSLKLRIVTISSLEMLSATDFNTEYIVPLIDARRNFVYGAVYDKNLDTVIKDSHILLSELKNKISNKDITYVSEDKFEFETVTSDYDIIKLISKHKNDKGLNPHQVNPNYLKLTEAEEKFKAANDL